MNGSSGFGSVSDIAGFFSGGPFAAVHDWFGNRRVATKVLLVASVAIVGTLSTGALSLAGIGDLQHTRGDEVGRAVPYITNLNGAALAAKAAANDERGYLIAGDTKFRDESLGRKSTVDGDLKAARALAEGPARSAIDSIQDATDAWFAALNTEFTTFATDRAAAVTFALGPNRDLRKNYEGLLDKEIARANGALVAGQQFDASVHRTRASVLILLALSLALAITLALYVGRLIVIPLKRVSGVLDAVASGDLSQDPQVHQGDELGRMADALRQAITTLRQMMSALGEHATTLAGASEELSSTSQHSAAGAETGARQAAAVASSAATMSANIATVATGAEQMGASIREISQNTSRAVGVASRAVNVTATTAAVMARLGDSSTEIGNVIKVITSIAEQTNLLALNATIEAARAGEAGKGFAVVAGEVKDLAQETARATGDIGRQVSKIQETTSGAVAAIEEISTIIAQINEFQTTIASAVEEQTATTQEMSRSVTEVADAGQQVARTVNEVASSVQLATVGAGEAHRAAEQLALMSVELRHLVDRFQL